MTTIAWRDGVVAADTGMTQGGSQVAHATKIVRNDGGDVAGAIGEAGFMAAFHRWFAAGEKADPPKIERTGDCDSAKGVVFRASGNVEVFEASGNFTLHAPYYAIGSGRCEALGAMHAGACAEKAIRAAIDLDDGTFGDVTVLRCEP